jgi:hypothetical protein
VLLAFGLGIGLLCVDAESLASSATSRGAGLHFPASAPRWLVKATEQSARGLGDPRATLVDLRLGRFPIVVIRGSFRCAACSRPCCNVPEQTGHYVTLRFDAVTRRVHDFGLSPRSPGTLSPLCSGGCRDERRTVIDSAQQAFDAAGTRVTLGDQQGQHRCLVQLQPSVRGAIEAECELKIAFAKQQTIVTFSETWTGLDRFGRRYAADSPRLKHVWRVIETPGGWVEKISSTGDSSPQ